MSLLLALTGGTVAPAPFVPGVDASPGRRVDVASWVLPNLVIGLAVSAPFVPEDFAGQTVRPALSQIEARGVSPLLQAQPAPFLPAQHVAPQRQLQVGQIDATGRVIPAAPPPFASSAYAQVYRQSLNRADPQATPLVLAAVPAPFVPAAWQFSGDYRALQVNAWLPSALRAVTPTPPQVIDTHDGGDRKHRRHKKREEERKQALLDAIDPPVVLQNGTTEAINSADVAPKWDSATLADNKSARRVDIEADDEEVILAFLRTML